VKLAALAPLLAVLLATAPSALAAEPGGGSLAAACQLDVQLFCDEIDREAPVGEVTACLRAHRETLTESCRAVVAPASVPRAPSGGGAGGSLADVCGAELRDLCGHAGDRFALARCIHTKRAQLSDACRDALDAAGGPGAGPGAP